MSLLPVAFWVRGAPFLRGPPELEVGRTPFPGKLSPPPPPPLSRKHKLHDPAHRRCALLLAQEVRPSASIGGAPFCSARLGRPSALLGLGAHLVSVFLFNDLRAHLAASFFFLTFRPINYRIVKDSLTWSGAPRRIFQFAQIQFMYFCESPNLRYRRVC